MKDLALETATEVLIKPFEGYGKVIDAKGTCISYPDPGTGGVPWTIGYGSTGPGIVQGTVMSKAQCEDLLLHHVQSFANGVLTLSPCLREYPNKFAAIISFAYNCGLRNYRISTLRKRVNERDWFGASQEILKWDKAAGRRLKGLTRRRTAESLLLLK